VTRIAGTLHKDLRTFKPITRSILLITRNASDKSFVENQNKHFMLDIFFPQKIVLLRKLGKKYGTARQVTV
jgi:hypothetical protein